MKLFFLCLLIAAGFAANAKAGSPALIVILLPGTSLQNWRSADAPNLRHLMETGAIAVMNTRTAHRAGQTGRETPQSALLTLGAGARAAGAASGSSLMPAASQFPGAKMSSGALFERRTGLKPQPTQRVCLDWPSIMQANCDPGYDLRLGSLADTLAAHGITDRAGGGNDADWVAAGSSGVVEHRAKLEAVPGQCSIWDAGSDMRAADLVIGAAAVEVSQRQGQLIVLSPYADSAGYSHEDRLTPVLIWGKGIPAGLICSPSTRRPGLVTNMDFAPSVAASFGISRTEFRSRPFGFAWSPAAAQDNVLQVERLNNQSIQQAQGQRILPYFALALGLWMLAATALAVRSIGPRFLVLVPMISLTAALFAVSAASFFAVFAGLFGLTFIAERVFRAERTLAVVTVGLSLALTLDMVAGNSLMNRGLLGYSAIEGARYYGIGNEAMGLLLGATLTAAALLWPSQQNRQFIVMALFAAVVLALGTAGAKAGGVVVSLAVFGTFAYTALGRRWTGRTAAALGLAVAAALGAAALGDAFLRPSAHSHMGEAVQRILSGGAGEAWDVVGRKMAVEGRLAYHSAWAVPLWAGSLCTFFLWKRMPPLAPTDTALRQAGVVGIVASLLLNDAGVVAGAIFVAALWSLAAVQKQKFPASEKSKAGNQEI